MRHSRNLVFFTLMAASLFIAQSAFALRLSVVGAGTFSKLKNDPETASSNGTDFKTVSGDSSLGLGGGALFGMWLSHSFELETGLLYISRIIGSKTTAVISGTDVTINYKTTTRGWQVPLLLRYHFGSYLSLGGGGYYTMGSGKVKSEMTTEALGISTTTSQEETYEDADFKKKDMGVLASVALRIPLNPATAFLVDGRYLMGLNDVNADPNDTTPAVKQKYQDIQALVGLQFGL